jgi:hypothetical protein
MFRIAFLLTVFLVLGGCLGSGDASPLVPTQAAPEKDWEYIPPPERPDHPPAIHCQIVESHAPFYTFARACVHADEDGRKGVSALVVAYPHGIVLICTYNLEGCPDVRAPALGTGKGASA